MGKSIRGPFFDSQCRSRLYCVGLDCMWLGCCVTDVENIFKENLINLMPVLVGRGQLVVKEVNGAKLTGKDLAQYFHVSLRHVSSPHVLQMSMSL